MKPQDKWLWHSIDEKPHTGAWVVMADENKRYFCGQWQNDGCGFDSTITLELPFGLKMSLPIDFKPVRWAYIQDKPSNYIDNLKEVFL